MNRKAFKIGKFNGDPGRGAGFSASVFARETRRPPNSASSFSSSARRNTRNEWPSPEELDGTDQRLGTRGEAPTRKPLEKALSASVKEVKSNAVAVHARNLRGKPLPVLIETVCCAGYRLAWDSDAISSSRLASGLKRYCEPGAAIGEGDGFAAAGDSLIEEPPPVASLSGLSGSSSSGNGGGSPS